MSFADLGLLPELLRAVDEKGYSVPTPIQAQAIPAVLAGDDVLAGAQTGTGKTAAFVLPILHKLGRAGGRAPRALVLTPTRELAAQVAESARAYGKYVGIRTIVVFGGVSINPQIDALRAGCDLLVATPGRLLDLAEQGSLDLRGIECFVLDEADRMLDMGFIPAIRRVVKLLPGQRQNLMFSATYSDDIRQLAGRILCNPTNIEVAPRNATAERVDQQVYRVSKEHKRHLLAHLIDDGNWHQVLVFTRTKHGANRLTQQLESKGIRAAAIHGNKSQGARVRALSDFKSNKITALVATEVAARGLDIKELPHVVNYELPNVPEDYVHRIGRTARAGGSGSAVSLVSPDEAPLLRDIERMLKRALPVAAPPKFEIVASPPPGAPHRGNGQPSEPRDGAERGRQQHRRDAGRHDGNRNSGNRHDGNPNGGNRYGGRRHEQPGQDTLGGGASGRSGQHEGRDLDNARPGDYRDSRPERPVGPGDAGSRSRFDQARDPRRAGDSDRRADRGESGRHGAGRGDSGHRVQSERRAGDNRGRGRSERQRHHGGERRQPGQSRFSSGGNGGHSRAAARPGRR